MAHAHVTRVLLARPHATAATGLAAATAANPGVAKFLNLGFQLDPSMCTAPADDARAQEEREMIDAQEEMENEAAAAGVFFPTSDGKQEEAEAATL